ncbi:MULTISPECIES: protein-export chaperone SecB [Bacillus]|uniref:protein-export chaperone SecB n=1 Tax=Bacillus TaxID=1386 RepID=UPI0013C82C5D|nr:MULTISPECIES: protein-export chaperone SecB [Bacillus]MDM5164538.1 protein-export chaperone SecB [Bacillus altitudinis]NEU51821.1 hypothetical protein [Bacillus altitudinis]QOV49129.1 protein-export chaperone SecB [Bacillus altitudinis]GLJ01110.1 hypothetical protein OAS1_03580 [Bacillus sp. YKCMOAS1]
MKAILQFVDYKVLNTVYKHNPALDDKEFEELNPEFEVTLRLTKKDHAFIKLSIEFGDKKVQETSLYVYAQIAGLFEFESEEEISNENKKELLQVNGLAILYPYIRSLVTDLTSKGSNEGVILPTVNISEMLRNELAKEDKPFNISNQQD